MSVRLRTLALALLSILVLAAILFGAPGGDDGWRPVTEESNASGLAVLDRWLRADGVDVISFRARMTELPTDHRGDVLLVHLPMIEWLRPDEVQAVRAFVRRGNALVVASSGDEDFHARRVSVREIDDLADGLRFVDRARVANPRQVVDRLADIELPPDWVLDLGGYERRTLVPAEPHPLVHGVHRLEVVGDLHGHRWAQTSEQESSIGRVPWSTLLVDADSGSQTAWTRPSGAGSITVLLHASLLSNGAIDRADNAVFARNLLTGQLGPGGRVLIDDGHQGLLPDVTGGELLSDGRFWATAALLILVWLGWLLADDGRWDRLVQPASPAPRRRADLVRAMGGFLARHLSGPEALDALLAPLRERLAQRHRVAPEQALATLDLEPRVTVEQRRELADLIERARRGRRIPLVRAQRLTLALEDRIT